MNVSVWLGRLKGMETSAQPWIGEPNRVAFEHAGLPCIIRRSPRSRAWCGYVGVPAGHPWHGLKYDEPALIDVEVHGGLTYSSECDGDPVDGVCHVPKPGESEHAWWLGFDCAHGGDIVPQFADDGINWSGAEYRDQAYVTAETKKLAEQARAVAMA